VIPQEQLEVVHDFEAFGIHAFTTTRAFGTLGSNSEEPIKTVMGRWDALRATIASLGASRLATAAQVHGDQVIEHVPGWSGWLRGPRADGHIAPDRGTAAAVTIADCVPVFIAHPSGVVAALHSGWRGTAARIVQRAISLLGNRGLEPSELKLHLGPAICGRCYEVSPEVVRALTGREVERPEPVDLRAIIAGHAKNLGVKAITISASCTRCNNDRFFSHRAGDPGRQVAVILARS
jgi:YfiH family protein